MAVSTSALGTYSWMRTSSSPMAFELFTRKPKLQSFDRVHRGLFWPTLKKPTVTRSGRKPKPSISMSLSDVNVLEKRRLQTQTITSIAPDVTTIRSLDWDRDRFDIEFGLQNGTTYNSFIINADKLTIIDASHEKFKGLYLSAIKEHIDPSAIEYIIANHTEPDHSGLIPDLLDLAPNATVVGSKTCIIFLQNLVLRPFKSLVVKGGSTLDLGRGHLLEFVMAPNLHWPDTMFTLDHGAGILFTCDAFGMHYCSELLYDEDLGAIEPHYRFYYDCLMRPNCRSVITALKRIAEKDFSIIATGHGPLLRYNVAELLNKYETWSKQALEKQLATVAVLYVSDYGFSDRLSQTLARGLTKTNTGVEMMDLNVVDIQDMIECVSRCAGVVIMAPPSSGPANKAITTIYAAVKPKQPVVIAESYGGDDEPVDTIVQRFVALGISLALPPLRIKEIPNEATYQQFEEAGTDLGQLLSQKKSIEAKKAECP
uniref:Flavodoxin-like domain-containing protein n=1 Tax=Picea sitchensis TaxID=3332 RepID=B8LNF7_PICSI|nr:unknown [Picea sitchensis]